jgi:hypothetical protein
VYSHEPGIFTRGGADYTQNHTALLVIAVRRSCLVHLGLLCRMEIPPS